MKSCLYRGSVWHTRTEPAYSFHYSVWYLGLYLDELDLVERELRLLSRNRVNLTSFWDNDYLALQDGSVAASASDIQLITMPRFFGYVFNPVSFFLQRDEEQCLERVVAEVHNTWGERHVYDLGRGGEGEEYVSETGKRLYVSPFMNADARYHFALRETPDRRLLIAIDESDEEGQRFFQAGIDVRPLPLTDANLALLLLRYPFVNLKTVAAIHWQGLKLWLRGEPFRRNPSREKRPVQKVPF